MNTITRILFVLVLVLPTYAYAGIFDDKVNELKKASEAAQKTIMGDEEGTTSTDKPSAKGEQTAATKSPSSNPEMLASSQGATISLEAISAFTVNGLNLSKRYQEMHEALLADGYSLNRPSSFSWKKTENDKYASSGFTKKLDGGESHEVSIWLAYGRPYKIRYLLRSPSSFNVTAAIADVKKQLGEPTIVEDMTSVDKQLRWQNTLTETPMGSVIYFSREGKKAKVYQAYYTIERRDIKESSVAPAAKAVPAPEPVKPKQATSTPAPAAQVKIQVAADPFVRANRGKPFGPDVVGLQLGMSLDKVDQMIKDRKQPREVIDGQAPRPFAGARLYVLEPGDEAIALFTLKDKHGERVAALIRKVYFDPNDSPSQAAIISSLENKYGAPSYKYENPNRFNRSWLLTADSQPVAEAGPETRACEKPLSSSLGGRAWRVNEQPYNWELPWEERSWGQVSQLEAAAHEGLIEVSRCGPTLWANYQDNSGMLTGPDLRVILFDGAWIIATKEAKDAADRAQGAKDLDL